MFKRDISKALERCATTFPSIVLTGPRQSGKTTLLKSIFPNHHYLNLEFPDVRELVENDPRGVIEQYCDQGIIIDEAQRYPEIL